MKKQYKWHIEKRNVDDLLPADYNPRKMTDGEKKDLEDSLDEFGVVIPVVINTGKRKNVLIGGHQRVQICKQKGVREIEVMVPDRELRESEEKRLNLRLNKNTGSWDFEKLKNMDIGLLLEVGFGDDDLSTLWNDVEVIDDNYQRKGGIQEESPKTKIGDMYMLGDSVLMCGDAMEEDNVKKLMGNKNADMLLFDKKPEVKLSSYMQNTKQHLSVALEVSNPNTHMFHWCDQKHMLPLQAIMRENGFETQNVCIWIKNNAIIDKKLAFSQSYDPCVYATRGNPFVNSGFSKTNEIMNKEVGFGNQTMDDVAELINIWIAKRATNQEDQKSRPITIFEKMLKRCTSPGDIIYNAFGGDGGLIIAALQLGRIVYTMEIDPMKCDEIINRWEIFTNKKSIKI